MLDDKNIFIWLLLAAITLLCFWWHIKENNYLSRQWRSSFDAGAADWLIRFAWSRTAQLLLTLVCCTLLIIGYDWQLAEVRASLKEALASNTDKEKRISALEQIRKMEITAHASQGNQEPSTTADSPSPQNSRADDSIADIYDPAGNTPDRQAQLDKLKRQYEEILVTYYFMEKCKKTNPNDFHIIISALSQEMASINAPGRLQYDIVNAAKGSYKEMYSESKCEDADVTALHSQYSNYLETIARTFTAR